MYQKKALGSFGHALLAVRLEGEGEEGEALGVLPLGVEGVGDAAGGRQVRVALREGFTGITK